MFHGMDTFTLKAAIGYLKNNMKKKTYCMITHTSFTNESVVREKEK